MATIKRPNDYFKDLALGDYFFPQNECIKFPLHVKCTR